MEGNSSKMIGALIALVVVIGGVWWFVASGDDEDESSETNTSQQAQANDSSNEQASQPEASSTIVELAQATDSLSTLVTAVVAADLVETLSGEGPFTVFAPTNDAFAALPDGTLESLLEPENVDDLTNILTYHVVAGEAFSTDLSDGQEITTVQGDVLTVSIEDGNVMINDAMVVTADVEASNGVVHVIDAVLLPQ